MQYSDPVKESERQFHNQRFGSEHDNRQHLDKWYEALADCKQLHDMLVRQWGKGRDVLEYGCADGRISMSDFDIARDFGTYHGIDISDMAIETARRRAEAASISNCTFTAMDAENMTFPDASFDVVYGTGILHHLNIERCYSEIRRVLRPGGLALFNEPLGHNPVLNYYRSKTPELRTPDEHPLLVADFRKAGEFFREVKVKYFGLSTVLAVPFMRTRLGRPLMTCCRLTDKVILSIPYIRRNAWSAVITMAK